MRRGGSSVLGVPTPDVFGALKRNTYIWAVLGVGTQDFWWIEREQLKGTPPL